MALSTASKAAVGGPLAGLALRPHTKQAQTAAFPFSPCQNSVSKEKLRVGSSCLLRGGVKVALGRAKDQARTLQKFRIAAVSEETEAAKAVEGEEEAEADVEAPEAESPAPAEKSRVTELLRIYRDALDKDNVEEAEAVEAELQALDAGSSGSQVEELSKEIDSLKDRYLRLNADFDNFRKRSDREKASLASSVRGDVIEELLPMIDNFERARDAVKATTEGEQKIDASYQSIYKQFVDVLKKLGIVPVPGAGSAFDPAVHEAIMQEESTEYAEGIVIQEFRKGFKIGDSLLRPAMVKVSSGPGPASKKSG